MFDKLFQNKFKKDLLFSYASQGIVILAGFAQLFLINRYFGLEVFGEFSIIVATIGIFASVVTARSSEAVTRFLKREELNSNFSNAKLTVFIGVIVDFFTALLLLLLAYFSATSFAELFLKDSKLGSELFLYAFVVFFGFLKGTAIGFFQAKERFSVINSFNALSAILNVIFIVLGIIFYDNTLKILIVSLVVSSILSWGIMFLFFLLNVRREYQKYDILYNRSLINEYWNFNLKTFLSSSLKAGNQNVENLILGYFVNAESVGIYQTIKKIISPIAILVQPLSMLFYPKMIICFELHKANEMKRLIFKATRYIAILVIVFGAIIAFNIEFIFELMKLSFNPNYSIYLYIVLSTSLITSLLWWVRIFSNTVNPTYSLYLNLMATIYQVIITSFFAYLYGLYGVMFSLLTLQLILACFWLYLGKCYVNKNV
ncbi:MAG: oligosaccharide flippase family protein [Alteromonadaceae bacterium]